MSIASVRAFDGPGRTGFWARGANQAPKGRVRFDGLSSPGPRAHSNMWLTGLSSGPTMVKVIALKGLRPGLWYGPARGPVNSGRIKHGSNAKRRVVRNDADRPAGS